VSVYGFPTSGYAYQAIAQSGPDQLYQLQPVNHLSDAFTSSALLLFYPIAWWDNNEEYEEELKDWSWMKQIVVGFGPTFLRGGSGEFAKQINVRAGYEITPDLLVWMGPSWRSLDVPYAPGALSGSIVSVPRPATTPPLGTTQAMDLLWSFGLAVDLDVLSAAAAAVTKAVTNPATGGSP
jgi:hypothetical protein